MILREMDAKDASIYTINTLFVVCHWSFNANELDRQSF